MTASANNSNEQIPHGATCSMIIIKGEKKAAAAAEEEEEICGT